MGATGSREVVPPDDSEVDQITTVFAPAVVSTPDIDPLLAHLRTLKHSPPIIPSTLKTDWGEIQRYTIQPVTDGLGSVHSLIQAYLTKVPDPTLSEEEEATGAEIRRKLHAFVHEMRAPGPEADAAAEKLEGSVRELYASVHSLQRMDPPHTPPPGDTP